MQIPFAEILNFFAQLKQLVASFTRRIIPLRMLWVGSNVVFILYAWIVAFWPTLVLHVALLPLNLWRLRAARLMLKEIAHGQDVDKALELLRHATELRRLPAGTALFRKGDVATEAYVVVSGDIELEELGIRVEHGGLLGEMGLFVDGNERTASAVCVSDAELLVLPYEEFERIYFANPKIGFALMRLMVQRLQAPLRTDAKAA